MDKLAVLLSLFALALGAYAVMGSDEIRGPVGAADTDLDARVATLEAELAALRGAPDAIEVDVAPDGATTTSRGGLAGRPAAVPDRVAQLEAEVASMRKRVDEVEDQTESLGKSGRGNYRATHVFFPNVDAAAKAMKLDEVQQSDLERIVDSTKERLEELYTLPNDEGVTWRDAGRVELKGGTSGGGRIISVFGDSDKLNAFKKTLVPGTSETYADAEQRIRGQGKTEARDLLSPEQQKTWDKANTDFMFGGRTGGVQIEFAQTK